MRIFLVLPQGKFNYIFFVFYLPEKGKNSIRRYIFTTARPPFGQKIVPIFWPAGKTKVFSGKLKTITAAYKGLHAIKYILLKVVILHAPTAQLRKFPLR
jgi:hypothetical protein